MLQLICHLIGDYTLQTSWMAREKSRQSFAAVTHAAVYTAVFVTVFRPPWTAVCVIGLTHFVIDRWALARHWTNCLGQRGLPEWLGVWLLIINDNTFHLVINYVALTSLSDL